MSEPVPDLPRTVVGDPGPPRTGATAAGRMERARFRAWLVTGPAGRLVGFILDFAKALRAHRRVGRGG